jgi:carbonic anhydrase
MVKINILPFARLKINYANRSARVKLVKQNIKIVVQVKVISNSIVIDEADFAMGYELHYRVVYEKSLVGANAPLRLSLTLSLTL